MSANSNLHKAKEAKNDEFYTQLSDIANELKHYKEHFKGKVVFCNCDDPTWSNFWAYFHLNFAHLGLKKLISTHYDATEATYKLEYEGGNDNDVSVGIRTDLQQNGDFRSPECVELLKEADIVVTNPPFSLFREYVAQLAEYGKKFIIIGNKNAITYKEFFPLIKNNQVWLGANESHGTLHFTTEVGGSDLKGVPAFWYTNLDLKKRHEFIDLVEHYSSEKYPKYDNYDAIEVSKTLDIPMDYDGVMGVPISFLDKYCPEQFEIVGSSQRGCHDIEMELKQYDNYWEVDQNGKKTGSSGSKTNGNANLSRNDRKHNYFINENGHIVQSCYNRIFIKHRKKNI